MSRSFKKVLIANRGEIAVRIASTLRDLNIRSVAVFSEADRHSPHVSACDEALCVGPPLAAHSYLNMAAVLAAAKKSGADAVHPGYGFLAENAEFARQVGAAGLVFIGPSVGAMEVMGNKTRARAAMQKAGVPTVPGSDGALPDGPVGADAARTLAHRMGYPVMLKAAAGGGGKGMRLVHEAKELDAALRAAASEAQNAFGNPTVYMEKAIAQPRHIEVQIFSSPGEETYFLGERECSMQRRHQKVIEECPSTLLDADMRQRMGQVACQAADAVAYSGAGTVEFLVDEDKNFYFLEMNTRLQVEHTVTELCYGLDLVAAQVRVSQGEALGWRQEALLPRGHAIQARLYAEDPERGFLPCPGRIAELVLPQGPGVRADCGVATGYEVPRYYDPMVAKIVCWGETRQQARQRLIGALERTHIKGIVTNIDFLAALLRTDAFAQGNYHTGSIAALLQGNLLARPAPTVQDTDALIAAAAISTFRRDSRMAAQRQLPQAGEHYSAWRQATWRSRGA